MIEQLVARVFTTRNGAHLLHWQPGPLARHEALDDFYNAVIERIDAVVEAHVGGVLKPLGTVPVLAQPPLTDFAAYIAAEAGWIASNRTNFSPVPAVQNLIDELAAVYLKLSYKLTFVT